VLSTLVQFAVSSQGHNFTPPALGTQHLAYCTVQADCRLRSRECSTAVWEELFLSYLGVVALLCVALHSNPQCRPVHLFGQFGLPLPLFCRLWSGPPTLTPSSLAARLATGESWLSIGKADHRRAHHNPPARQLTPVPPSGCRRARTGAHKSGQAPDFCFLALALHTRGEISSPPPHDTTDRHRVRGRETPPWTSPVPSSRVPCRPSPQT